MHTTNKLFLEQRHGGLTPPQWSKGDTFHQKAKFIAMVTWSLVKPAGDPDLPNCDLSHQERLIGEVESLMAGNKPGSPFGEQAVKLISELKPEDIAR